MMDAEVIQSSIALERFSLDFRVDVAESIEWTKSFDPPDGDDYVFAAGQIWLTSSHGSTLLVEKEPGANLVATLSALKQAARSLRAIPGFEERIPLGGWCDWMRGYWGRLNADASTPDDDAIYTLLIPAMLIDGRSGWVAAYRYRGARVLEAGTRNTSLSLWSNLDPDLLCASVDAACRRWREVIRARL